MFQPIRHRVLDSSSFSDYIGSRESEPDSRFPIPDSRFPSSTNQRLNRLSSTTPG
ncbi:MAG: hypothetical protein F6J94_29015 [Moorea sp. SIO1F2]|uniref:hypothetical protein n=1 Tax=Moorena sp. SIO3I8 TaxID=2607833 RepID=UPI0013BCAA2C|nr:hypothetical protein [Moorena sp. SIO3I8]NEN97120.1 hypothetical protein [Moorena sp. SIO3I7]NEO07965.1 hypothetical protein [Moorena sp. SIO3I8]NET85787.1 hypothetical protein [Moorena sp. SIO1F2]